MASASAGVTIRMPLMAAEGYQVGVAGNDEICVGGNGCSDDVIVIGICGDHRWRGKRPHHLSSHKVISQDRVSGLAN